MQEHQKQLILAAKKLGIQVTDLNEHWHMDAIRLKYGGKEELVFDGLCFSNLSVIAKRLANNKYACKLWLNEQGVPAPKSCYFQDALLSRKEIEAFLEEHPKAVCKPLNGMEGQGILMGLTHYQQLRDHWLEYKATYEHFIIEPHVEGVDLRVHAIDGQIIAACTRVPAYVIGNGEDSLAVLIDREEQRIKQYNPENQITRDIYLQQMIEAQGVSMETVIEQGHKINVKAIANMSQGARAIDVTDQLHPRYQDWLKKVSDKLKMPFIAMDFLTTDVSKDPKEQAAALEINAEPAWLHHTFSEGKQHPIPELLLKHLFQMD